MTISLTPALCSHLVVVDELAPNPRARAEAVLPGWNDPTSPNYLGRCVFRYHIDPSLADHEAAKAVCERLLLTLGARLEIRP